MWLALVVAASLDTSAVRCPAYPGDPPWRRITCYILSRLAEPDDRPPFGPANVPEMIDCDVERSEAGQAERG